MALNRYDRNDNELARQLNHLWANPSYTPSPNNNNNPLGQFATDPNVGGGGGNGGGIPWFHTATAPTYPTGATIANTAGTTAATSGAGMDPQTWALLLGAAGQGISAYSGMQEGNANRAMSKEELAARIAQQEKDRGLAATQLDPFTQQRSRQKQALLGALLNGYQPASLQGSHFSGGAMGITPEMMQGISQYFSPDAMGNAEQAFQTTASGGSKYYMPPDPAKVGYPQSTVDQLPPLQFPGAPQPQSRTRSPLFADLASQGTGLIRDPNVRERTRRLDPRSRGIGVVGGGI